MTCFRPLKGWSGLNGKLVFKPEDGTLEKTVPCGYCKGCRIDRSAAWAIRCVHEAQMHAENSSFITLTYANEHLPADQGLHLEEWQTFLRKLRKKLKRPVRYFHCGEYGKDTKVHGTELKPALGRPHFHACLFGVDFDDKYLWSRKRGISLYRSPQLESVWNKGFVTVGDVTWQSAAYCARYIMKKVLGEKAEDHYQKVDEWGEIHKVEPEYTTQSKRPGLGSTWFKKYWKDVYPSDQVIVNGKAFKPPRYYDKLLEKQNPEMWKKVEATRKAKIRHAIRDGKIDDSWRLAERELCKASQIERLIRELD